MRVPVIYIGPHDEVEFDEFGLARTCAHGDAVLVDDELAGRAPVSIVGIVIDPGCGLLAQSDNWQAGPAPVAAGAISADTRGALAAFHAAAEAAASIPEGSTK